MSGATAQAAESDAKLKTRAALASTSMAIILLILKSFAVYRTGSVALLGSLADTGLDVLTSLITLFGVRFAAQPADGNHRFGHGKAEAVVALFQVIVITGAGLGIGWAAIARFIDTRVIAADSLIVRLCGQWGVPLTPLLATLLLTGMSSDSSSFMRVEGNGAPTFETLAVLCNAGADYTLVMDGLRRRKTPGSVAIWGALLSRAAWIGHVLWTEVTPAVLMETGADESDGEGVINWLVGTRDVGAAAIFYQGQGNWRASLRSTTPAVDVAAFARRYGGGGHVMASGCTFAGGTVERDAFLAALVEYKLSYQRIIRDRERFTTTEAADNKQLSDAHAQQIYRSFAKPLIVRNRSEGV